MATSAHRSIPAVVSVAAKWIRSQVAFSRAELA
jgi:hypothetical protein